MSDTQTGPRPSPGKEYALVPHPDFPSFAIRDVTVSLKREDGTLSFCFVVTGDADGLLWPKREYSSRAHELWKHTCFEAFVGHPHEGYTEYNFSPSSEWACYSFDGYRNGMRPTEWLPEPVVTSSYTPPLRLNAQIDLPLHDRDGDAGLALSAVIEAKDGTKSYWALAHAPGPPDFHHVDGFVASLDDLNDT